MSRCRIFLVVFSFLFSFRSFDALILLPVCLYTFVSLEGKRLVLKLVANCHLDNFWEREIDFIGVCLCITVCGSCKTIKYGLIARNLKLFIDSSSC